MSDQHSVKGTVLARHLLYKRAKELEVDGDTVFFPIRPDENIALCQARVRSSLSQDREFRYRVRSGRAGVWVVKIGTWKQVLGSPMTIDDRLRLPCGICGKVRNQHVGSVLACFGGYGTYWNPDGKADARLTSGERPQKPDAQDSGGVKRDA